MNFSRISPWAEVWLLELWFFSIYCGLGFLFFQQKTNVRAREVLTLFGGNGLEFWGFVDGSLDLLVKVTTYTSLGVRSTFFQETKRRSAGSLPSIAALFFVFQQQTNVRVGEVLRVFSGNELECWGFFNGSLDLLVKITHDRVYLIGGEKRGSSFFPGDKKTYITTW